MELMDYTPEEVTALLRLASEERGFSLHPDLSGPKLTELLKSALAKASADKGGKILVSDDGPTSMRMLLVRCCCRGGCWCWSHILALANALRLSGLFLAEPLIGAFRGCLTLFPCLTLCSCLGPPLGL
jgi:hypothetical protein